MMLSLLPFSLMSLISFEYLMISSIFNSYVIDLLSNIDFTSPFYFHFIQYSFDHRYVLFVLFYLSSRFISEFRVYSWVQGLIIKVQGLVFGRWVLKLGSSLTFFNVIIDISYFHQYIVCYLFCSILFGFSFIIDLELYLGLEFSSQDLGFRVQYLRFRVYYLRVEVGLMFSVYGFWVWFDFYTISTIYNRTLGVYVYDQ